MEYILSTKYQKKITKLKNKKILQQDQVDKLLPPNSNATDSSQFDITLICILIRNCTKLPGPLNGWDDNKPPPHDQSLAAFVIRAREWRNFVHHTEPKNITLAIFQQKWAEGATIIHKLGFQYDTNKLLNISLDPQHKTFLKPLFHYFKNVQDSLTKQHKALDQQQQTLTQDIADLEKQQSKNTHDIADLMYQQQCAEQEQIFLKQQQKITEQTSDSNTKEIKKLTDQLNLTLDQVSSLLEQLEIIRDEVEDLKEKKFLSSGSHCLEEVLQKIEQLLTDQEHRRLLKNLGIEYEEGMTIQELLESVPWKDLKKELEMMRRYNVVEHIQKTTLITNALQTASNKLRKKYRKDLIKCLVEQPLSSTEMTEINVFREDIFIDLMVLPSSEVDRKWNNSDREALMEQQYLPKSTTHNAVDQIFSEDDELAFIRGYWKVKLN
ncbi:E3 ubiquitin-protein ligase DZIP3-like [Clytia hemisphaerica]|uniref:E3 ubiquitin-protein ligase DZIP3-like n=1 Tax=Clytia hemisphaerica TaxID=252671 RepID=UPI0034D6E75E